MQAANTIIDNFDLLINSGYHSFLVRWISQVKRHLRGSLEVQLLLEEQSLRRHRQELVELYRLNSDISRIAQELSTFPHTLEKGEADKISEANLRSRYHLGTYYFVNRDYVLAIQTFAECLRQSIARDPDLRLARNICDCLVRVSHAFILWGDIENARKGLQLVEFVVGKLRELAARLDLKRDGIDKRDVVTRDSVRNERD